MQINYKDNRDMERAFFWSDMNAEAYIYVKPLHYGYMRETIKREWKQAASYEAKICYDTMPNKIGNHEEISLTQFVTAKLKAVKELNEAATTSPIISI